MASAKTTTYLSTKGQLILPKAIRDKRHWRPGMKLEVEDTAEGVLVTAAPLFKPTRPEDVYGMLPYKGRPKTIKEMNEAIEKEVKRRHARGRY